ncbi:hypothetical protein [Arthrobacter sp. ES3-54]|uniref:hypothetical protein n=1 Tax=Arthrobacter sp. ES3-54 TaxID=1502991 RepID=UPI002404F38A|nr:hypothetical protein [Arthrobacter sp. ES3-54]MDF9752789.1 hypothetical protein [Arthrobacter sp. ES3-54]
MTSRAVVFALAGTVVLVFAAPYVLALFGMAPNGTETLLLVAGLWAACWVSTRKTAKAAPQKNGK